MCLAICLSGHAVWGAPADWWHAAWRCKRRVVAAHRGRARPDAFWVEFLTGGLAARDGADIRVIAAGVETPCRVVSLGPGDLCRLAVKTRPGVRTYAIYYGNPAAKKPLDDWRPAGGLLLETRRYRGGGCDTWQAMHKALGLSEGHVLGRGFVSNVFHGFNLFGPSEKYISMYTGVLLAPTSGRYVFATTSDDASFLFVDGRPVVSWAGFHRAVPFARFTGAARLERGSHRFAYYHAKVRGTGGVAVAAWQLPGANQRLHVIPPGAFAPILRGRLTSYELRDQDVAPDFRFTRLGECHTENAVLIRVRFEDRTYGPRDAGRRWLWDFGDNTTAEGRSVEHVYPRPAVRNVTLTLRHGARAYAVTNRVDAGIDWLKQATPMAEPVASYRQAVMAMPHRRLDPEDWRSVLAFLSDLRADRDAARVFQAAASRGDLAPGAWLGAALTLRAACRRERRLAALVAEALGNAEEEAEKADVKAGCAIEYADLMRGPLARPDEAMRAYHRVLKTCTDRPRVRRAHVGLGDCYRLRAERDPAEKHYRTAQALRDGPASAARDQARIGAFAFAAAGYVREGEFDAADEMLDQWESEYPTQKLAGHSSLLRARSLLGRKQPALAARELETLLAVNEASQFADEALLVLADCYGAVQPPQPRDASRCLRRLIDEHPDSPLRRRAEERLKKLAPE